MYEKTGTLRSGDSCFDLICLFGIHEQVSQRRDIIGTDDFRSVRRRASVPWRRENIWLDSIEFLFASGPNSELSGVARSIIRKAECTKAKSFADERSSLHRYPKTCSLRFRSYSSVAERVSGSIRKAARSHGRRCRPSRRCCSRKRRSPRWWGHWCG